MSSSYHDPSSPHYNPFSEEQSTGGSSLSSSDKRDKRTPTQVHNPPLTYNTQHPSFAEAVGSGRLLSGAGPTGAFVPPTLPPQAQAQQQQASIQHAFFPSSLNQPPLSYDEKAPLTSESVPVITMQDYDQAGNFRQQQQYGVGQQRTSQGLPPLANLFEDTTPYGRVRHQLIESYSVSEFLNCDRPGFLTSSFPFHSFIIEFSKIARQVNPIRSTEMGRVWSVFCAILVADPKSTRVLRGCLCPVHLSAKPVLIVSDTKIFGGLA